MAYSQHNLAYDLRLFEEPYYEEDRIYAKSKKSDAQKQKTESKSSQDAPVKKSAKSGKIAKVKRRKSNFGRIALGVILGLCVMVTVAAIIHGQVQLTELNQEIIDARSDLSEKQSVYTQLEMKVDSNISTSVVEEYAKENLDMSKASNSQKEFISLSQGDKAEVTLDSHENVFEAIADLFRDLLS